jgi:hypothetical protein
VRRRNAPCLSFSHAEIARVKVEPLQEDLLKIVERRRGGNPGGPPFETTELEAVFRVGA